MDIQRLIIEEISEVPDCLAPVIDMMCESCKYNSLHKQDECHNELACFKSRSVNNLLDLRFELSELASLDGNVQCCTCTRQKHIDGKAWIYCEVYNNNMLLIKEFDETGETQGCSEYQP